MTREELLHQLEVGDFDAIRGAVETAEIDFKRSPYRRSSRGLLRHPLLHPELPQRSRLHRPMRRRHVESLRRCPGRLLQARRRAVNTALGVRSRSVQIFRDDAMRRAAFAAGACRFLNSIRRCGDRQVRTAQRKPPPPKLHFFRWLFRLRGARWPRCAYGRRSSERRSRDACVSSLGRRNSCAAISPFVMPSRTRPSTWSSRAVRPSARWRSAAASAAASNRRNVGRMSLRRVRSRSPNASPSVVGDVYHQGSLNRGVCAREDDPRLRLDVYYATPFVVERCSPPSAIGCDVADEDDPAIRRRRQAELVLMPK